MLERDSEVAPLEDRAIVPTSAGDLWRIFLPGPLGATMREDVPPLLVTNLRLRFRVSLDEEQVEMTGFCGDVRLDFGIRAHHYPRKVAVKLLRPSAVAVECARLLR